MSYNPLVQDSQGILNQMNWVLVDKQSFNNVNPNGLTFDVSGSERFRIVTNMTSSISGTVSCYFSDDNNKTEYSLQTVSGNNTNPYATYNASSFFTIAAVWGTLSTLTLEFDKRAKKGTCLHNCNLNTSITQLIGFTYSGSSLMNSVTLYSNCTFTGTIEVYKWQDIKTLDVVSYEVVKEITVTDSVINETVVIDGDINPNIQIITKLQTTFSGNLNLQCYLNNDTNTSNYQFAALGNDGSIAVADYGATSSGLYIGGGAATLNEQCCVESTLNLKSGTYRFANHRVTRYRPSDTDRLFSMVGSRWLNTVNKVTSLVLSSGTTRFTGTVIILKQINSQIIKQFQNPIELIHNKNYNDESVNTTIDISDCDVVEIDWTGTTNTSNNVNCYFGTDSTAANYSKQHVSGSGETAIASSTTGATTIGTWNGSNASAGKLTVIRKNKIFLNSYFFRRTSGIFSKIEEGVLYTGSQSTDTISLSGTGFTGQLKVYKKY